MLDLVTTLVMFMAAVVLVWYGTTDRAAARPPSMEIPVPKTPVSLTDARMAGSSSASVVLGIFCDFECPYCARFESSVLPTIREQYVASGRVALAFWNYPLSIHPSAKRAAQAAECVSNDAQFWTLHDIFFGDPKKLDSASVEVAAGTAQVDLDAFRACLRSESSLKAVQADIKLAKDLGVKGTPGFLVGRRVGYALNVSQTISGGRPPEEFVAALEKALRTGGL